MKTPAACLVVLLACGCEALTPASAPLPKNHSLADARGPAAVARPSGNATLTLIVSPPHAAAGFDSEHIIYLRQPSQPEYFAHNEWVDTPARMLAPLIVAAAEASGAFRAVVPTPSTASGDLRLDTEVLRLQHEFFAKPSRVRFTLRAYLVETSSRRVIASREFEAVADAATEDPHGGVIAATQAVRTVLGELGAFCAESARGRQ